MKNIDTVIFDLDGTLLYTLGDLHACFNHAITKFGYPERNIDEIRSFVGNGIKKAIERALPHKIADDELEKIVAYFRIYYKDHMLELTKPYDGILELLGTLKENGFKLAIVSNKYDLAVKGLCKNYFDKYIDVAIGEGNGIRKKPEADGTIKAINELGSHIENAIFIGDSDVDIMTAKNVGIPCISALWGYRDKGFLEEHGAKIFAETPKEIEKILYLI